MIIRRLLVAALTVAGITSASATPSPYYNPTGNPAQNSAGSSALMRQEFNDIAAGFALLPPVLTGQQNKALVVNAGGTSIVLTVGQLSLGGNLTTSGALTTTGAFSTTWAQTASTTLTLPPYNGTIATLAGAETLTNKTFDATSVALTAAPGTNNTQFSTTAFTTAAVAVETARATAAEALKAPLASPALTGVPTAPTASFGTNNTQIATTAFIAAAVGAAGTIPAGLINGLTLSNDGTTPNTVLDIAAGRAADSLNAITIVLSSPITKSISAVWATGSGNGGMGTGLTATASTWYHAFAIIVAATSDVYLDTSPTAANKPAGTTAFRYIGSILLDSSANIVAFVQNVDRFDWVTPPVSFNGATGGSTAVTVALQSPLGIVTEAILTGIFTPATPGADGLLITSLAQADVAPTTTGVPNAGITAFGSASVMQWNTRVVTNASSSVRMRTTTNETVRMFTNGWIDTRGR